MIALSVAARPRQEGLPAAGRGAYLAHMLPRTFPAGFIAPCLPTRTDKLPSSGCGSFDLGDLEPHHGPTESNGEDYAQDPQRPARHSHDDVWSARAAALTPTRRRSIARKAALIRWSEVKA